MTPNGAEVSRRTMVAEESSLGRPPPPTWGLESSRDMGTRDWTASLPTELALKLRAL